MKVTNRTNCLSKDDTVLEVDGIEGISRLQADVVESVETSGSQNRFSCDPEDDTELEIDGVEDKKRIESEFVDLWLEQGSKAAIDIIVDTDSESQIDIVLGQPSTNRDTNDIEGDTDIEIEGLEMDAMFDTATVGNDRDYALTQSAVNEFLFDDEFTNLNPTCQNGIARFQIGETSHQVNVKTWCSTLVSRWCMKLAKRGHSGAQHRLGCMYALGSGVKQNQIMAYTWCKVAALDKSSGALSQLKEIESKLTSAHISYAKMLSEQYYKMYVLPFKPVAKI